MNDMDGMEKRFAIICVCVAIVLIVGIIADANRPVAPPECPAGWVTTCRESSRLAPDVAVCLPSGK